MSKPKIYAFCKAGCAWEAVHKEDFLKSAAIVDLGITAGESYSLAIGKTYKIKNTSATDEWGFTITYSQTYRESNSPTASAYKVSETISLPDYDKYADGIKVKILDVFVFGESFKYIYEINGTRYEKYALTEVVPGAYGDPTITVAGATHIYLINDGANIYQPYVLTEADKAEIVQAVLESMGAAVYGFVDEDNNIVLTGALAEDTYSVKYEMEDGSTVDIGDLSLVTAPTYTNLATKVTEDYRLNSSGAITANNGTDVVEDYIPFAVGDVVRIKGLTLGSTNVAFYNSSKTSLASGAHTYPGHNSSDTITWEKETDTVYKYTNVSNSSCAYVRFGGVLTGATTDVIVTLNEPIE